MNNYIVTVNFSDTGAYTVPIVARSAKEARNKARSKALSADTCSYRRWFYDVDQLIRCPVCDSDAVLSKDYAYCTECDFNLEKKGKI